MIISKMGFEPDAAWGWTLREYILTWAVAKKGYMMSDQLHADREWGEGLIDHLRNKGIKV